MATQIIEKERLKDYLDHFSIVIPTELTEIEVASLELGDQIAAEWVPLSGLSYDPKDDVILVDLDNGKYEHTIQQPVEFAVQEGDDGIQSFEVKCSKGHLHIIKFRQPRQLPPAA
ncbi:MAG TPA: hypothetical protein ENI96_12185 [Sedimenticola thiotaurini]|uniref:Uncharacterized protein n=1 Tax=Sedimenticola thiotaurini TaxID=1543721 RepID=A0A831RN78_9GAMM|nr:hypothetical protein [Sedimenticola thiotaurini]